MSQESKILKDKKDYFFKMVVGHYWPEMCVAQIKKQKRKRDTCRRNVSLAPFVAFQHDPSASPNIKNISAETNRNIKMDGLP